MVNYLCGLAGQPPLYPESSLETSGIRPEIDERQSGVNHRDYRSLPMPKESTRKYKPPVRIPLPFDVAVEAFLKVDPKKLPGRGKMTTKAAKKGKK